MYVTSEETESVLPFANRFCCGHTRHEVYKILIGIGFISYLFSVNNNLNEKYILVLNFTENRVGVHTIHIHKHQSDSHSLMKFIKFCTLFLSLVFVFSIVHDSRPDQCTILS